MAMTAMRRELTFTNPADGAAPMPLNVVFADSESGTGLKSHSIIAPARALAAILSLSMAASQKICLAVKPYCVTIS
jgi:hypothetical protein